MRVLKQNHLRSSICHYDMGVTVLFFQSNIFFFFLNASHHPLNCFNKWSGFLYEKQIQDVPLCFKRSNVYECLVQYLARGKHLIFIPVAVRNVLNAFCDLL